MSLNGVPKISFFYSYQIWRLKNESFWMIISPKMHKNVLDFSYIFVYFRKNHRIFHIKDDKNSRTNKFYGRQNVEDNKFYGGACPPFLLLDTPLFAPGKCKSLIILRKSTIIFIEPFVDPIKLTDIFYWAFFIHFFPFL